MSENKAVTTTKKPMTVSQFFYHAGTDGFLTKTLGDRKGQFISNVLALTESDSKLQKCDPEALMKCAMNATSLNLPLNKNLGYAYVIPYEKRGGEVIPNFQIGWKGFVQLAIRSGQYKTINSVEVRNGEIKRNKFTGEIEFIREDESEEVIGYLAYIKLLNGFEQSLYMSIEQVESHADKYSQAYKKSTSAKLKSGQIPQSDMWKYSSPWYDNFDDMAKKTVLKLLLSRYGVLSTEMEKAIEKDQSDHNGQYTDNPRSREVMDAEVIHQPEPEPEQKTLRLEDL